MDKQAQLPGSRRAASKPRPGLWVRRAARIAVATSLVGGLGWWVATASATDPVAAADSYYVSIGDSYAAGYRPSFMGPGATSRDGFAYRVEEKLRSGSEDVRLVNFACSGTTAYGMAFDKGCADDARAPGGPEYTDTPQAAAAVDFISEHRDRIKLVTLGIGANDLLRCANEADPAQRQTCAEAEVPRVRLSLDSVLERIRAAVGPNVPIVGVSYINVYLADALKPDGSAKADAATILFQNYLNPTLAQTYSKYGAKFVDTTALAGGYLPSTDKTYLEGHGTVPASIGRVCSLTYYCTDNDPHPNRAGHDLIAGEVEKAVGL
ncbi:SGNH/GDSL hydrolase family protein [Mycobacterium neglectum]|uniref:SGNH/GDSL hydrolase family protein n=1 Tax=Mycobacterium neglectum TaxID=242737 RepID=UPI000BFEC2F7|nr:GDSL-type esterase/lipase family protein [Mycobacterium neglectum]